MWEYDEELQEAHRLEYRVEYSKKRGFTCTCDAGQEGFCHCYKLGTCKHCLWSVAHAVQFADDEIRERAEIQSLVGSGVTLAQATATTYFGWPGLEDFEQPTECKAWVNPNAYETSSSLTGMIFENGIPMGYAN